MYRYFDFALLGILVYLFSSGRYFGRTAGILYCIVLYTVHSTPWLVVSVWVGPDVVFVCARIVVSSGSRVGGEFVVGNSVSFVLKCLDENLRHWFGVCL